jgi:hypothetical protein
VDPGRRIAAIALGVVAALVLQAAPATSKGGEGLVTLNRAFYAPGETARLTLDRVPPDGPYLARLIEDPFWDRPRARLDRALVHLALEPAAASLASGPLRGRLLVPALSVGRYRLSICAAPCGGPDADVVTDAPILIAATPMEGRLLLRLDAAIKRLEVAREARRRRVQGLRRELLADRVGIASLRRLLEFRSTTEHELRQRLEALRGTPHDLGPAGIAVGAILVVAAVVLTLLSRRRRSTSRSARASSRRYDNSRTARVP